MDRHRPQTAARACLCLPLLITSPASAQSVAGCWDFEQGNDQLIADISGSGNFMYAANCMDPPASLIGDNRAVKLGGVNEYLGVIIKPDTALAHLDQHFTAALRIKPDDAKSPRVILAYQHHGLGWTVGLNGRGELITGLRGGDVSEGLRAASFPMWTCSWPTATSTCSSRPSGSPLSTCSSGSRTSTSSRQPA